MEFRALQILTMSQLSQCKPLDLHLTITPIERSHLLCRVVEAVTAAADKGLKSKLECCHRTQMMPET